MPSVNDLRALLERVRAATGPDRELNARILCALVAPEGSIVVKSPYNGAWCIDQPRRYGKEPFAAWEVPRPWRLEHASLTASIDAALALVERVLPGAYVELEINANKDGHRINAAFIRHEDRDIGECWDASKAPLAILAALLTALITREAPHAD